MKVGGIDPTVRTKNTGKQATKRNIPKETDDSWYTKGSIEPVD
jgi:hypothetical protein